MVAFLIPRLDYLSTLAFSHMTLQIEYKSKDYKFDAKKAGDDTVITCSAFKNTELVISRFEFPEDVPAHRLKEYQEAYYASIVQSNKQNDIVALIEELPSPMYLGLERRSLSIEPGPRSYLMRSPRSRVLGHKSIFGRSIGVSLDEALYFAQQTFQNNRREELKLDEEIRKNLVLGLLSFEPIELVGKRAAPTKKDYESIELARANLQKLPRLLRVDEGMVSEKIDPLFDFLDKRRLLSEKKIPKNSKNRETLETNKMLAEIEWSFNKTHLSKINFLSEIVSDYHQKAEAISRRSNEFLDGVNSFLGDSGKTLKYNGFGELVFHLDIDKPSQERDLRTLSSGEIQLIVILTHLYFNPEVEKANVFIIDEPELSLHVQWQERFVEKIMSASNETQYILATHAPSIILDKTNNCVEIPAKK